MLKIIGIISSLVLPHYTIASNQGDGGIPLRCFNTVPCKLVSGDDCRLSSHMRGILLSDLLTASQAKITQSLKTVADTRQQQGAQPLSHVATGVLKPRHLTMLFPVR
jgi:hypothetical protein